MLGDQVVEDLPSSGRDGVDVIEVSILGVGYVVVDVDPEFGLGSGVQKVIRCPLDLFLMRIRLLHVSEICMSLFTTLTLLMRLPQKITKKILR